MHRPVSVTLGRKPKKTGNTQKALNNWSYWEVTRIPFILLVPRCPENTQKWNTGRWRIPLVCPPATPSSARAHLSPPQPGPAGQHGGFQPTLWQSELLIPAGQRSWKWLRFSGGWCLCRFGAMASITYTTLLLQLCPQKSQLLDAAPSLCSVINHSKMLFYLQLLRG